MSRARRRQFLFIAGALLAFPITGGAQQNGVYRIGVILHGGPYLAAVDGLRNGLKELGLEDGKHFLFHIRNTNGDASALTAVAKSLEDERVDVIFAVARSVSLAARRATKRVPIVFYSGTDPVAGGLVESFRKPGGRLTGVYGRSTDLTAKRFQFLKAMVPTLRRAVTFYNPGNPGAGYALKLAHDAARQVTVDLVERPVTTVAELRAGVRALRPGDADAFCYMADAMVISQTEFIIDTAKKMRMATIFADPASVAKGALASYGESYYAIGQLSAKYVQQILKGANPGNLPVEQVDRLHFAINLRTAEAIGLSIPQSVLLQADEIIK